LSYGGFAFIKWSNDFAGLVSLACEVDLHVAILELRGLHSVRAAVCPGGSSLQFSLLPTTWATFACVVELVDELNMFRVLAGYDGCPWWCDVMLLAHLRLFLFAFPYRGQERLLVVPSIHVLVVVLHFNSWHILQRFIDLNISFQESDVILNAAIVQSER